MRLSSLKNSDTSEMSTVDTVYFFLEQTRCRPLLRFVSHQHVRLLDTIRLEDRLASSSRTVKSNLRKIIGGRNRSNFDSKIRSFTIHDEEFVIVEEKFEATICTPTKRIEFGASSQSPEVVVGTPKVGVRMDNAGSRSHKKRIEQKLQENTTKALDFVETYGVIPKTVVCEKLNGDRCVISVDGVTRSKTSYENMTTMRKEEVKDMLSVCDQKMISDTTYHEIAQRAPDIPRKSHIISCRNEMNSNYNVMRTPGMLPGSYLSLKAELAREITSLMEHNEIKEPVKVKISGDGAKVSRVSNFVTVSFMILTDSNSQSHTDQKVLAIVNCDETYKNLKKCFGPLFDEINDLSLCGELSVMDKTCEVELMVGGDMKFIQLLLGLNGSISTYACPWCKVAKENRGDMTVSENHYHTHELLRSMQEMKDLAMSSKTGKQAYGVVGSPLLNIEPINYVPDELHLLMRITDVLLRNLIDDARSKDDYGRLTGESCDNLELLVKAIQSCGLAFKTWTSKSGDMEWTSLSGNDKKKLLRELPDKLVFCIHEDTRELVVSLWKEFEEVYRALCSGEDADKLFEKNHRFLQHFLQIGQLKRLGYHPKNVTPYMHVLVYHVPYFVKRHGGLSKFSGQGVEKTNDIIKQVHQMKSCKVDSTVEALFVRKRIESSPKHVHRKPRKYVKQNDIYWNADIKIKREAKRRRILEEIQQADEAYNGNIQDNISETLSVKEIKAKLAELGIKTKLRKKEKLLELLRTVNL